MTFEIAIGNNGKIWINSSNIKNIIVLINTIKNACTMEKDQIKQFVKSISTLLV